MELKSVECCFSCTHSYTKVGSCCTLHDEEIELNNICDDYSEDY
jgi:hypothetical protein